MPVLLNVQMNIVLSILLLIIFGLNYFKMNRKKIINRIFMWIVVLTWITLVLEIFSIVLNNPGYKRFLTLHKLVNIMGFILAPSIAFLGYMFSKEWVSRYQKEKIKFNYILLLPLVINCIATLISYNTGWLFHINNSNIYIRGPLFFILPCVSFIYFGYNLYFIYKYKNSFTSSEFVIFNLLYIVPLAATIIQLKYSFWLTTWNSTAIIMVFAYIFILNDQSYHDSLTGLENRLSYENYAQNINSKKLNKLFIIYIDIDGFKSINDKYGHSEGDEAIKLFANLLTQSFKLRHKKLIRLGGDEFLILLEEEKQERVLEHIKNLTENVEEYNKTEEKPYKLSFSYGIACYTNAYENVDQLLEYVDQLMYKQKKTKLSSIHKMD